MLLIVLSYLNKRPYYYYFLYKWLWKGSKSLLWDLSFINSTLFWKFNKNLLLWQKKIHYSKWKSIGLFLPTKRLQTGWSSIILRALALCRNIRNNNWKYILDIKGIKYADDTTCFYKWITRNNRRHSWKARYFCWYIKTKNKLKIKPD